MRRMATGSWLNDLDLANRGLGPVSSEVCQGLGPCLKGPMWARIERS